MSRNPNKGALALLLLCNLAVAGDTMYVQSVKAELHQDPKLDSPAVATLARGNEVAIGEKQGMWVKATVGGKSGWVSRLFLSSTHPVGEAELNKDIDGNLEKASRRRSSSYAVSASSRGLMTDERARNGQALYRTDFDSLDALEKWNPSAEQMKQFRADGKLGQ